MQTLPPLPLPSPSSSDTTEFKTLSVVFGNGYRQDRPDGINDEIVTWNLVYENINKTDYDSLVSVLKAAKSWDTISWIDPNGVHRLYKMTEKGYSKTQVANLFTLRFELKSIPGQSIVSGEQYAVDFNFEYIPNNTENFSFSLRGQH